MNPADSNRLSKDHFIRTKLYGGSRSTWKRYAHLVVGSASFWELLKYELITFAVGSVPGALGLWLRKVFYPVLFKSVGSGVIFGRNLVIRNGRNIVIGDRVVIDDQTVVDARGAGEEDLVIGDEAIINRDVMLIAKAGALHIGTQTDIGARSMLISTGGIYIGNSVALAGNCKIGGATVSFDNEHQQRDRFTRGAVLIEDECTVFPSVIVLDGVRVGRRSSIGPNLVLRDDVPQNTLVVAHQRLVSQNRNVLLSKETGQTTSGGLEEEKPVHDTAEDVSAKAALQVRSAIIEAVYAAIDELNQLRAASEALTKSLNTQLFELDSMDKVNLIVETEQRLYKELGIEVRFDNFDDAMPKEGSPFSTVGAFANYIEQKAKNKLNDIDR